MIPITVHVRENRVEEFYIRFAEFIKDIPDASEPVRTASGIIPAWAVTDSAQSVANAFMEEVSFPGRRILYYMYEGARKETVRVRPVELAEKMGHPNGVSSIAGLLGGVGKAIRRVGLPMYRTPSGKTWHYVWDWDGEYYSMTPEMAQLLRKAAPR